MAHGVGLGAGGHREEGSYLRIEGHVLAHGQAAARVDLDAVLLRHDVRLETGSDLQQTAQTELSATKLLLQSRYRLTQFVDLRLQAVHHHQQQHGQSDDAR